MTCQKELGRSYINAKICLAHVRTRTRPHAFLRVSVQMVVVSLQTIGEGHFRGNDSVGWKEIT